MAEELHCERCGLKKLLLHQGKTVKKANSPPVLSLRLACALPALGFWECWQGEALLLTEGKGRCHPQEDQQTRGF